MAAHQPSVFVSLTSMDHVNSYRSAMKGELSVTRLFLFGWERLTSVGDRSVAMRGSGTNRLMNNTEQNAKQPLPSITGHL